MRAINGSEGLCMTCNNAPACYYHARRGPALFCELFDDYTPPIERGAVAPVAARERTSAVRRETPDSAPTLTGLCINCEHRRACAHPKQEGGVWHCEDYE
jgi:hypothetical protein